MDRTDWNERYASSDLVWSAGPNRFLPAEVVGLAPGRALDLACGEGRNALWLAEQGWEVVAVDFAEEGIAKGRRLAADRGLEVDWRVEDVTTWTPEGLFDLVIVFYLQLPPQDMRAAFSRAAGAVGPGGILLSVTHDLSNLESGHAGPSDPEVLTTPESVAAAVDGLVVERAQVVERPVDTPEGERIALDTLVRAHRRTGRT